MVCSPCSGYNRRDYASVIFARYLESKVANNSDSIIATTWQRYKNTNGNTSAGNMTAAIDWAIKQHNASSSLADEFPKFTWNNYFMITGTYDIQVTNVYTNLATLPPTFTGPEWKLFRSHLKDERKDWQAGNAGALTAGIDQYPRNGPLPNYNTWVENLGAGYVEFFPRNYNQPIAPRTVLSVTITVGLPETMARANARVSVLPIINLLGPVLPNNNFLTPRSSGVTSSNYSFRIANFDQCNRVTIMANILSGGSASFNNYEAQLVPQPPTTPVPPCFLQLP